MQCKLTDMMPPPRIAMALGSSISVPISVAVTIRLEVKSSGIPGAYSVGL